MSRRYVLLATDGVTLYTHPWTDKIIFPGIISVHFRILGEEFRSSGGKFSLEILFFQTWSAWWLESRSRFNGKEE